jgi:hypothetical protein
LGGWGRWRAGEAPRLLDQAAEPLDGLLVGAEVVAVQRLLGAPVLFGLLLQDLRQRRRGRRWLGVARLRGDGGPAEDLVDRVGQLAM